MSVRGGGNLVGDRPTTRISSRISARRSLCTAVVRMCSGMDSTDSVNSVRTKTTAGIHLEVLR